MLRSREPSNHRVQDKSSHFRESAACTTAIRGPRDRRAGIWPPEGQYDNGALPYVSMFPKGDSVHYYLVEVHQASSGVSALWAKGGLLTLSQTRWSIKWETSTQFTTGQNPAIAI